VVYDSTMATGYARGRRLRAEDIDAWMTAALPYLPAPGGLILDLGSGTGRFTDALAATGGATVVACEPSADMRANAARAHPLVGGTAETTPFRDGVFDAIWASQVVHHVGDLAAFATEVRRILKPGGHLLLRGGFGRPEELPYFRYFPDAWGPGTAVSLSLAEIRGALGGLDQCAHVRVEQTMDEFVERARSRSLSNLAALPDDVFQAGLRALEQDARAGALPPRIVERLDLVVFVRR
jgi:SAM-dependent methyltransferase